MEAAERRARVQLLDAAEELFYHDGIRATGVDAVARKAGVTKPVLYRSFPSKDELVSAYLERRRARFWDRWDSLVDAASTPRDALFAIVDHLGARTTVPGYRGCPFMNAAIEFPEMDSPHHGAAVSVKAEIRARLHGLCAALDMDGERLGDEVFLLIEGAYAAAHTLGGAEGPARTLSAAVRMLVG